MLLGYARVSTLEDQSATAQARALREAGCQRIYEEVASGGRWERPELHRLLDHLRPGDTLVVWKMDRLSRPLRDALTILEKVEAAGAGFRSLSEAIDTTTPAGRMMAHMIGAFADSFARGRRPVFVRPEPRTASAGGGRSSPPSNEPRSPRVS